MITLDKVEIYRKFGGDVDGWVRMDMPRGSLTDPMQDRDWFLIDELIQALTLIQSGLASTEFEVRSRERIAEVSENELVRDKLIALAQSKK